MSFYCLHLVWFKSLFFCRKQSYCARGHCVVESTKSDIPGHQLLRWFFCALVVFSMYELLTWYICFLLRPANRIGGVEALQALVRIGSLTCLSLESAFDGFYSILWALDMFNLSLSNVDLRGGWQTRWQKLRNCDSCLNSSDWKPWTFEVSRAMQSCSACQTFLSVDFMSHQFIFLWFFNGAGNYIGPEGVAFVSRIVGLKSLDISGENQLWSAVLVRRDFSFWDFVSFLRFECRWVQDRFTCAFWGLDRFVHLRLVVYNWMHVH